MPSRKLRSLSAMSAAQPVAENRGWRLPESRSRGVTRVVLALCLAAGVAAPAVALFAQGPGKADGPQPAAEFAGFPDWVPSVAFAPDGKLVAAGSYGTIRLFDPAESKSVGDLSEPAGFVKSLAFTPDGTTLVAGTYQAVSVFNVAERKRVRQLKGHRGYVTAVALAAGGQILVTASEDETVRLWDLPSGELRQTISGLGQPALGVAVSPNGALLAVATGDTTRPTRKGAVRVYDLEGKPQWSGETHTRAVAAVAFSPDGATVATAGVDEAIKFWEASTGKELRTLAGHERPVNCLEFFSDGRWLVSASGGRNVGGNEIKLWDVATGKERATLDGHAAPVLDVAVSPDGKLIASASSDKTVNLWRTETLVPELAANAAVAEVAATQKAADAAPAAAKTIRVGIIGLDTSHCPAFTEILNAKDAPADVAGCRVVAAYPKGSRDIESSTARVPEYTKKVEAMGVEIVDSIDSLLEKVDAVLLETNDGRPHLEQVLPVLKAGKPVFIDKPIAGSLADAVAIFEAGRQYKVPLFSSSSLRYTAGAQGIRNGKIGDVKGCDAYSPCSLEATHPDLFWYGIHGVESLFTVMGTGCETVTRVNTPGIDVAVGVWSGGRVGTFRGVRSDQGGGQAGYGGTAFGTKGVEQIGTYGGYRPLVVEIVSFFRTGKVPVTEQETLEIYAFMEAADESKRQGGVPVKLEAVLAKAREEARKRLKE